MAYRTSKPLHPTEFIGSKTKTRTTSSGKVVTKSKTVEGRGKKKTTIKKKEITSPTGTTLKYKTKVKMPTTFSKTKRTGTPYKADGSGTQAGGRFKSVSKVKKHTSAVGDRMVTYPKSKVKNRVDRKGKETTKRKK
tara:strand:- start:2725 stop:3132 length:408 start_codon:yes stop_codon:yes gene_type:complete